MLPDGLSMLWESVEPDAALRDRFGFDDLHDATAWVTAVLDQTWGIRVRACPRLVISAHNAIAWVQSDRGDLVVKWARDRERFADLVASTRLLRTVAEEGLPVALPITALSRLDRVELAGPTGAWSVTVQPELSGEWLDVADHQAVRAAGACLAELHAALGAVDHEGPATETRPGELPERVAGWLAHDDRGLAPGASQRLADLVSAAPVLDDVPQLVHNDFRAANLLTRNSMIVGVLDFDEMVVEHRVSDLAKASVYLSTLFRDWGPTSGATRAALRAGYESVRPLGAAEGAWWQILVLWQGIMAVHSARDPARWAAVL